MTVPSATQPTVTTTLTVNACPASNTLSGQSTAPSVGEKTPPSLARTKLTSAGTGIYGNQATGASKPANLQSIAFSSNIKPAKAKVTLNASTGKIGFGTAAFPAKPIRNFIVKVEVKRTGGESTLTKRIRVHIHEKITELWLTPSTLHVPLESKSYRFTVLAQFDDEVVGDISYWPPVLAE